MDLKNLSKSALAETFTFNLLHPETSDELGGKNQCGVGKIRQGICLLAEKTEKRAVA